MNNKKRIFNLEYFREMLHICPKIPNQTFDELPFKEKILAFLRNLGHSEEIKNITDVNVNKLHQPWRSFDAVINKCLSDFAYLLWEDFVYQVEHKDAKKSNEMYYPRDDQIFMMIKLVSRLHNTQQFGVIFPVELTNEDIKNSAAYKERLSFGCCLNLLGDGASWSTVVEEGEPVDSAGSGAITLAIEAMTLRTGDQHLVEESHCCQLIKTDMNGFDDSSGTSVTNPECLLCVCITNEDTNVSLQ
nr:hypothetical protein [Tanacetum cinerariifolium]